MGRISVDVSIEGVLTSVIVGCEETVGDIVRRALQNIFGPDNVPDSDRCQLKWRGSLVSLDERISVLALENGAQVVLLLPTLV